MFTFMPLESRQLRRYEIQPGEQTAVLRGTSDECENVIRQHAIYGMIDAREISRSKNIVDICYSLDTPVSVPQMMKAQEQNRAIQAVQGLEARKRAAVAGHDAASDATPFPLKTFETEIVEQVGPTETPRVNEKMDVVTGGSSRRRKAA